MSSLEYNHLASALKRLGYGNEAAAYHGALCGALCREPIEAIDPADFLDDGVTPDINAPAREELWRVRDETAEALADEAFEFSPLLPDDDVELTDRAQALSAWCGGFLFGLAGRVKLELEGCSEAVREVVEDFSQLTRAALDPEGDAEVEESAYAELIEYVRVSAQLVYMELHPRDDAASPQRPTLH